METKLVRENRKMRKLTVAAAALLVVLAGTGIAGASVMTLTVVVDNTTLYMDGNMGPTSTMYHVYASASGNTFQIPAGQGTVSPFTFYGGVRAFEINARFTTATGQLHPTIDTGSVGAAYATAIFNDADHVSDQPGGGSIPTAFLTQAFSGGIIVNSAHTANPDGVGGLGLDAPGKGVGGRMGDSTSSTAYRASPMTNSTKKFTYGNTDSPYTGFNTAVWLYSGELNAVAPGAVTVNLDLVGANTRLWQLDATYKLAWGTAPTTMNGTSFEVTINPNPPTVSIPGGDVLEKDWDVSSGGWNDLGHWVDVTAVGSDPDNGPVTPLTYEWIMSKPGSGSQVLGETGAVLNLTLAEIASLGLPPYVGKDDPSYHWGLSVRAYDGVAYSDPAEIGVFVPEPATMSLLALGGLALLKRKRKS
jgi:hypothetical protein